VIRIEEKQYRYYQIDRPIATGKKKPGHPVEDAPVFGVFL
jgi:hypothetical protein